MGRAVLDLAVWAAAASRAQGVAGVDFVLRLGDDDFSLHLRGQIDLLVIDQQVDVIDYKTTTPSAAGLEPYAFQLGCYALAARRFVEVPGVEVRAGISYLRRDDATPVRRDRDARGQRHRQPAFPVRGRACAFT